MKLEAKNKESKIIKFISFPNKLNLISLIVIVVAYCLIAGLVIGLLATGKDYVVVPEYEEMTYSEKINPFFKVSSSYTINTNGELTKADTFRFYYYGVNNNNSTSINAQISAMYDDGRMVYYSDKTSSSKTYTGTQYITSGLAQKKQITNIYANVDYTVFEDDKNYNVQISEKILELSKQDLKSNNVNNCSSASFMYEIEGEEKETKIFKAFNVSATTSETNNEEDTIKINFSLFEESSAKYHLDLQMFVVDEDGEIYNLVGWYNLSNNAIKSFSKDIKFTKSIKLSDVYVKVRYLDINGDWHELLYKNSYSSIHN